ncbi:Arabinogalactan protein 16/20/22/41 [Dioscorea alata]|uniref:Arabinogalactan protein 16/20/22/41 n=1 Tax=Dioscorea alata TaxID=55571 RepID=A0ACB7W2Z9_DIOAL|nr:Arabinogalactan protein 16/20/22/41 [Dioscorea alata]
MMSSMMVYALILVTFFFSGLTQMAYGQALALSSTSSSSFRMIDGKAIDQGIAYVLILVVLLVTYFVH